MPKYKILLEAVLEFILLFGASLLNYFACKRPLSSVNPFYPILLSVIVRKCLLYPVFLRFLSRANRLVFTFTKIMLLPRYC